MHIWPNMVIYMASLTSTRWIKLVFSKSYGVIYNHMRTYDTLHIHRMYVLCRIWINVAIYDHVWYHICDYVIIFDVIYDYLCPYMTIFGPTYNIWQHKLTCMLIYARILGHQWFLSLYIDVYDRVLGRISLYIVIYDRIWVYIVTHEHMQTHTS